MIDFFNCKPLNPYKETLDKNSSIKIKREGLVPKGDFCNGCEFFYIDLEPRINPWNDEVERTVNVPKCKFFDELLFCSEKGETPCGEMFDKYKKCLSCFIQTNKDCVEIEKATGLSVAEIIALNIVESIKNEK